MVYSACFYFLSEYTTTPPPTTTPSTTVTDPNATKASQTTTGKYNLYSWYSKTGTETIVQFRQVFGLHRFKLHRHLVDVTVKSVWFRQVFSLLRVQ